MNRFWHSFVPFVASLILFQGLLGHCTSADTVKEESLIFLQERYGEPFRYSPSTCRETRATGALQGCS